MVAIGNRVFVSLMGAVLAAGAAHADHMFPPFDPELVVLISSATPAQPKRKVMTRTDLESLPQVSFASRNLWSAEEHAYSGPSLLSVIEAAGASKAKRVVARSVTDYRYILQGEDIWSDAPIIATRIDGEAFGLRKGGPFWIVYPYDTATRHTAHDLIAGSVGQLIELKIEPE